MYDSDVMCIRSFWDEVAHGCLVGLSAVFLGVWDEWAMCIYRGRFLFLFFSLLFWTTFFSDMFATIDKVEEGDGAGEWMRDVHNVYRKVTSVESSPFHYWTRESYMQYPSAKLDKWNPLLRAS